MKIYRAGDAVRFEPPGHFGSLEVSTIVDLGETGCRTQLSYAPPGGGGDLHLHEQEDQVFVVVAGELTFRTGEEGSGEEFTLQQYDAVLFKAGEPHFTLNESDRPSVSVVITVPA